MCEAFHWLFLLAPKIEVGARRTPRSYLYLEFCVQSLFPRRSVTADADEKSEALPAENEFFSIRLQLSQFGLVSPSYRLTQCVGLEITTLKP